MNRSRSTIFCTAILLALFAGPRAGDAAESQDAKPAAEEPVQCYKKFGVKGRPHRISSIATLNAIRAWSDHAQKYGKEYAMWNEVENGAIKCDKMKRSDYYLCFVSGKPCRTKVLTASGAKKAG